MSSSLYPQPINGNLTNNSVNTTHTYTNQDQGDVRADWNASDKDHLFGRYSQAHILNPTTNSIPLLYNSETPTRRTTACWITPEPSAPRSSMMPASE